MTGGESIVDSTYRWCEVAILTALYASCLIYAAYQRGFPKRAPVSGIVGGVALVVAGLIMAPLFGESILDAALLRARFGFMVPDEHPHGYGWALMFGYAIVVANVTLLAVGAVMTSLGKVPPWISSDRGKDEGRAT